MKQFKQKFCAVMLALMVMLAQIAAVQATPCATADAPPEASSTVAMHASHGMSTADETSHMAMDCCEEDSDCGSVPCVVVSVALLHSARALISTAQFPPSLGEFSPPAVTGHFSSELRPPIIS